jgi:hypothetical protein
MSNIEAVDSVVTLSKEVRERAASPVFSSSRDHLAPRASDAFGGEMALDVGGVVDGGVG